MHSGSHRHRRLKARIAAFATAALVACPLASLRAETPPLQPQRVDVSLDRAKLLRIPEHVDTIVVGSPVVADVTMLKGNNLVVVTGKAFGETNIIFLDKSGQALSEALVSVQRTPNLLTVQRGLDRESYACNPRCEPAVALGDATKFLQETSGQITARNGLNAGPAH